MRLHRSMSLLVGLTFDLKPKCRKSSTANPPTDQFAEFDTEETLCAVENALKARGHKVIRIGSARYLLKKLAHLKCDIVFNIAEGLTDRNRESQVPILLEMSGIPHTASDALTLSVCLDKIIAKKIFLYHKIPTPRYFECNSKEDISIPKGLNFPFIVKPRYEGSAKGIGPHSKANDQKALKRCAMDIIDGYRQPALVEEFIDGWEFTVGVIGNKKPVVFPVVQRYLEIKTDLSSHIFEKAGADIGSLKYKGLLELNPRLESEIRCLALETYSALGCRDIARMDFRVRPCAAGPKIYLLEVNPLPSLAKDDYFSMAAELLGLSYNDMINMILDAAVERCRL